MKQLNEIVGNDFIPAIAGDINCSDIEIKLLSFLPKLRGLAIPTFSDIHTEYTSFQE